MHLPIFQSGDFTADWFAGSPAAVVPMDYYVDGGTLHAITAENNLSETAVLIPDGRHFRLRGFAPTLAATSLCSHRPSSSLHDYELRNSL